MNILNESLFVCKFCQETFKYENADRHGKRCSGINFKCPTGCGLEQDLNTEAKLMEHLKEQCELVCVTCTICASELLTSEKDEHNCVDELKQRLASSQEVVRNMQLERQQLNNKISQLEEEIRTLKNKHEQPPMEEEWEPF